MTDPELDAAVAREVHRSEAEAGWSPSSNLHLALLAIEKAADGETWQLTRHSSPQPHKYTATIGQMYPVGASADDIPTALSLCALAFVRCKEVSNDR